MTAPTRTEAKIDTSNSHYLEQRALELALSRAASEGERAAIERLAALRAELEVKREAHSQLMNARRHVSWPAGSQHEFLAHEGAHSVYGMNCVYQHGHHGNAVVSRHPIPTWENIDISHHPVESRGDRPFCLLGVGLRV